LWREYRLQRLADESDGLPRRYSQRFWQAREGGSYETREDRRVAAKTGGRVLSGHPDGLSKREDCARGLLASPAMKVVLVATDGSDSGIAALKQAADIASAHDAQLIVLTVISRNRESRSISDEVREYAHAEHLEGETEARSLIAENILAEAKPVVAIRRGLKAIYISRAGDPADEILACAREHSADEFFLEVAAVARSGPSCLEASRKVANLATCTVTIIPRAE
jgi:nucleotide-binding universal stress UspA family protein